LKREGLADTRKDLAVEIREFFIPDFSSWKTNHDAYKEKSSQSTVNSSPDTSVISP